MNTKRIPAAESPHREELPFQHYTLRHRLEAWVSQKLFGHFEYRVRRGLLKGMRRRGGLAWIPDSLLPVSETPEMKFWRELDLSNRIVFDAGAFHGLLALHFAKCAQQVICFEPSTRNFERLNENIHLNKLTNVRVLKLALGASAQTCEIVSTDLMPGGGTLESRLAEQIQHSNAVTDREIIDVKTLDVAMTEENLPTPDFIKIDVEGLEADVLRGARSVLTASHPALFLEMHGATIAEKKRKVAEIVDILQQYGYRSIRHIESNTEINPTNSATAMEGHLYARRGA